MRVENLELELCRCRVVGYCSERCDRNHWVMAHMATCEAGNYTVRNYTIIHKEFVSKSNLPFKVQKFMVNLCLIYPNCEDCTIRLCLASEDKLIFVELSDRRSWSYGPICAWCARPCTRHNDEEFVSCLTCERVVYCSTICRTADWISVHKTFCFKRRPTSMYVNLN